MLASPHPQDHTSLQELQTLRQHIDAIDEELVALLARRFEVTDQVGELKAKWGLGAVDADRESAQAQRLHLLAGKFCVSPALVNRIFRSIVDQVVLDHKAKAAASRSADH